MNKIKFEEKEKQKTLKSLVKWFSNLAQTICLYYNEQGTRNSHFSPNLH